MYQRINKQSNLLIENSSLIGREPDILTIAHQEEGINHVSYR